MGCLLTPFFLDTWPFSFPWEDLCLEGLQYLGRQLDLTVPDTGQFHYRHVNSCRHRVAILRYLGIRRATDRDRSALRMWIIDDCRGLSPAVEEQIGVSSGKGRNVTLSDLPSPLVAFTGD